MAVSRPKYVGGRPVAKASGVALVVVVLDEGSDRVFLEVLAGHRFPAGRGSSGPDANARAYPGSGDDAARRGHAGYLRRRATLPSRRRDTTSRAR